MSKGISNFEINKFFENEENQDLKNNYMGSLSNFWLEKLSDCRREKQNHCITSAIFWRDFLCHFTKVQNYQNKTGENTPLYPNKYVLTTYFKEF